MTKVEEQILKNQIVILGLLQDLQEELQPISSIQETHDLIIQERKTININHVTTFDNRH